MLLFKESFADGGQAAWKSPSSHSVPALHPARQQPGEVGKQAGWLALQNCLLIKFGCVLKYGLENSPSSFPVVIILFIKLLEDFIHGTACRFF